MARVSAPLFYSLLLISSLILASQTLVSSRELSKPSIVKGLSWDYYFLKCPKLERIVRKHLEDVFEKDNGQAPGLLRLFFHDCFADGCDASILLGDGDNDEKKHDANIGLREEAIQTIENLRILIYKQCLPVVSCSDIIILAAREAVRQLGGPDFDVPLGRKDSLTWDADAPDNLPAPFFLTDDLLEVFGEKNFDASEVVALSGAHTYGRAHCPSLVNRTKDPPPIDPDFKNKIFGTCPNEASPNTVDLDVRTPMKFDNMYYINLLNRQGVMVSDQDLATHPQTKEIVNQFASDQKAFFNKFADAFVKVSQINVITDRQGKGEIRDKCFFPNKRRKSSVVEEVVELAAEM
ncbi:peroxidase 12 [Cajanus cajan]|uniref:Peroxidase n=1 Tax=Cajanus cajan TaxID=3821 RepID=A0A151QPD8_CAJCA|nr:peroxidase 12 [Cajanus cajan]KYP32169.1 Peroxidase 12 [Cajanus cajan]